MVCGVAHWSSPKVKGPFCYSCRLISPNKKNRSCLNLLQSISIHLLALFHIRSRASYVFQDLRFSPLLRPPDAPPPSPLARAVRAARFGLDPDRLALRRFCCCCCCCWRRRLVPPLLTLFGLTSTPYPGLQWK